MKRKKNFAAAAAAFLIGVAALTGLTASPAQAANGNANIAGWCASTYAGSVAVTVAPHNAYSWRCRLTASNGQYQYLQISSMTLVCRFDHSRTSTAYILNNNSSNPLSWRCT
jgi:hypothetical protein